MNLFSSKTSLCPSRCTKEGWLVLGRCTLNAGITGQLGFATYRYKFEGYFPASWLYDDGQYDGPVVDNDDRSWKQLSNVNKNWTLREMMLEPVWQMLTMNITGPAVAFFFLCKIYKIIHWISRSIMKFANLKKE